MFVALLAYNILLFILAWAFLPETNGNSNRQATQLKTMVKNYKLLFSDKNFLAYAACSSAALAGLIVYSTISPFLLQDVMGLSVIQYGWLAIAITIAMILGRGANAFLVIRVGMSNLIMIQWGEQLLRDGMIMTM